MAGGRSGGSGGAAGQGPDGDDFDWLYDKGRRGSRSRAPADPPRDPDATRLLPTYQRPTDDRRTGDKTEPPPARQEPPRLLPPERRPRRRRRFRLRWLVYAVVAWLVYLVAVPVYAWMSVSTVDADPGGDRPAEQPGTTYLVVGSDARAGLDGQRTDTVMLLHTGAGPNLLMSIPRDSLVEVPGHGQMKINAAYGLGGAPLLVQTVEQETGIRVDHYIEIGFAGLVRLVDAVGGVRICPETAIDDPQAKLTIEAGCQEVDGETALGYARSRKSQQLGDIDRARHQREVVSAIGSEVLSWQTVVNPVRYWRVMAAGASSVQVSEGTGPFAAARFLLGMTRTDGEHGLTCGVPITDLEVNWDRERADRLFGLIAQDRTSGIGDDLCRPSGLPD